MPAHRTTSAAESEIRELMQLWVDAVRSKDSSGLVSNIAHDAVVFDLINPLQYVGVNSVKQRARQWLSNFEGPLDYEMRDLQVAAADDVAFCHSLNHVSGINHEGTKIDMWWRATVGLQKRNGEWVVTHEHSSVPFNMETMQASLDLQP